MNGVCNSYKGFYKGISTYLHQYHSIIKNGTCAAHKLRHAAPEATQLTCKSVHSASSIRTQQEPTTSDEACRLDFSSNYSLHLLEDLPDLAPCGAESGWTGSGDDAYEASG